MYAETDHCVSPPAMLSVREGTPRVTGGGDRAVCRVCLRPRRLASAWGMLSRCIFPYFGVV